MPLLIISYYRPIYTLLNRRSNSNIYLDELWCNLAIKTILYINDLLVSWESDTIAFTFTLINLTLYYLNSLRIFNPI